MITLRALPFLTAIALPLAACADDDSSATTTDESSTTGTPDPTTTPPTTVGSTTADTDATGTGPGTGADTSSDTGATATGTEDTTTATDGTTGAAGLEIAGEWLEEFSPGMGITHVIGETRWDQLADFGDAVFHVDAYDNAARTVVAQGDAANEFFPELWSRFDWTWDGEDLYYCTAVFDAPSAAEALAAPASDPGDLAAGCGGFGWSRLMPTG